MSASPAQPSIPSQKRPLEEPSSDTGPGEQPEAKRPALDSIKREPADGNDAQLDSASFNEISDTKPGGAVPTVFGSSEDGDTISGKPISNGLGPSAANVLETQPIQSSMSMDATPTSQSHMPNQQTDETGWLHLRSIISSAEAATLIGKGGENVTSIRRMSGAKCTVSDYSRGAVERILTVSGLVDAVAKAFGLIIRTLNVEPLDQPSGTKSKTYPLRLLIPHVLIGSIIGQKGARIREIQEKSGARLNVSDSTLPLSTERTLVVLGVADSVHIATFYVGSTLVEQLTERFGGPAASAYATRSGGPAGVVPGGLQVVPYAPQPAGGQWGHPDGPRRQPHSQAQRQPFNSYAASYGYANFARSPQPQAQQPQSQPPQAQAPMVYSNSSANPGIGPRAPQQPGYGQPQMPQQGAHGMGQQPTAFPGQPLTQQIYIPNDMVGAIIGKGGAKINEIRQLSGSVIKINEPQDNSNERLVTITGTQECNQMALYLLYQRLESEKHRI